MALKPDRNIESFDVEHFYSASGRVTNRGCIVMATGAVASGAAMDQSVNQVDAGIETASGLVPVGLLSADVVDIDFTRQILNPNKSEHQLGDKVPLVRRGWVVTNFIDSSSPAITEGAPAYTTHSGYLSADAGGVYTDAESGLTVTEYPRVGKWLSKADEDGYAKVYIDL